jgi:hypothetical protein
MSVGVWIGGGCGFRISSFLFTSASLASALVLKKLLAYLLPLRMKSYLHPLPFTEYTLIEILLTWKEDGPLELPSAKNLPVFIDPGFASVQILGYLLRSHYPKVIIFVKVHFFQDFFLSTKLIFRSNVPISGHFLCAH